MATRPDLLPSRRKAAAAAALTLVSAWPAARAASDSAPPAMPAASAARPAEPPPVQASLEKYSTTQLREFLLARRDKSIGHVEPAEIRALSSELLVSNIQFREKMLYLPGAIRDFFEIRDLQQIAASNSVAMLLWDKHLAEGPGTDEIVADTLGQAFQLCSGEKYFSQPAAGFCTGFVVGSDLVATAAHCVDDPTALSRMRIAFGFREQSDGDHVALVSRVPAEDVYRPVAVVARQWEPKGVDFALLRTDRPIRNHAALQFAAPDSLHVGDGVYVLGHPMGLPMKLAEEAVVRSISEDGYFVSNLDTFGGNSGSPVFRSGSTDVQGILVRGDTDYVAKDTCQVAFVCPTGASGCLGEESTMAKYVVAKMPAAPPVASRQPFTRSFSSPPVPSGVMKAFSDEYLVMSDPAPPGFRIAGYVGTVTGDRACNAWATCRTAVEGDRVAFRFRLQGHAERAFPGQALSQGSLVVTYAPD